MWSTVAAKVYMTTETGRQEVAGLIASMAEKHRENRKWCLPMKPQGLPPCIHFLQKGSITFPNSLTGWRPRVQADEPTGHISHSSYKTPNTLLWTSRIFSLCGPTLISLFSQRKGFSMLCSSVNAEVMAWQMATLTFPLNFVLSNELHFRFHQDCRVRGKTPRDVMRQFLLC